MMGHYALLILLRITGYVSAILPHVIRMKAGYLLGRALMILSPSRVEITRENIVKAFPTDTPENHEQIVYGSYHNLGIVLLEISAMYFMRSYKKRNDGIGSC